MPVRLAGQPGVNTMIGRRHLIAGIGASAALWPLARHAIAQTPFVIPTYGGTWAKLWEETLIPEFAKATGIQGQIDVSLGKDFVSKIRAAGSASPFSVFMGNENIAATLRAEGFFEPLDMAKIPNAASLYDGLINKDNNGVRAIVSPIGLAWRTDLVKTAPKSWTDLWENPETARTTPMSTPPSPRSRSCSLSRGPPGAVRSPPS